MRININTKDVFTALNVDYAPMSENENIGNRMIDFLQDNYFNGADNAVIYIGFSTDNQQFEFELIPN